MRWFWIDRFIEFESGRRAKSIKHISLAEEQVDEYMPAFPVMPCSLIIEGLAQTAGLLVAEHNGFRERVVLAKVSKATFHDMATPGETLTYTAVVEDIRPTGAICKCTSHLGDRLHAEIELVFAHLGDDKFAEVTLFPPIDMLRLLRFYQLYEIGRNADGSPLQLPPHLLEAEQADQ